VLKGLVVGLAYSASLYVTTALIAIWAIVG
jgi:hypothetical protein